MSGKVAEVWRHGNRAGVLWNWTFDGVAGDFRLEAERYSCDPLMWGDERDNRVTVRLLIGKVGMGECEGTIWTPLTVDGHSHKAVVVKGARTKWQSQPASPEREPGRNETSAQAQARTAPARSA